MSVANSWADFAQRSRDEGGLGLEKHQAAGLVGNLQAESGPDLNPWGPTGDNGSAWGAAQWRNERLDNLKAHAASSGADYRTTEAQQAFMRHELDGSENRAYKAVLAAKTPEEAASAWNTHYERSADRSGRRESTARQYNDGPTAIETAMGRRPSGTSMMAYAEPGALTPMQPPGALNGGTPPDEYGWLSTLGQTLKDMAPGIAQDPQHAAALEASASNSRKIAGATGKWSQHIDPKTGIGVMINDLTGQRQQFRAHDPVAPEKTKQEDAYATGQGKAFSELNQSIQAGAVSSRAALGNLDTLRSALSNPDVIQGTNGETIAYLKKAANQYFGMDFKGVADADVSAALINKLTQESRLLNGGMPGSLSDKDLAFLKAANPGLDKDPVANQRILDIYTKLHNRNIEMNDERLAYTKGGKMLDEGFNQKLSAKWAAEHAADNAAFKAAPAATTAPQLPKGVKSIQLIR